MTNYPRYPNHSPETTLAKAIDKADILTFRLNRGIKRLILSTIRRRRLDGLLGLDGHTDQLTMGDANTRKASSQILFTVAEEYIDQLIPKGMPCFHITFVDDLGLTTDQTPVIHLAAYRRKVDKALRAMGLSGIVVIEIQALTNYPAKGKGRTLMLHAHALCWGPVSRRALRAAKEKLNSSRSWSNTFGAQPIKTRQLKNGVDDALKTIVYQTKVPLGAKYRWPIHKGSDHYRFRPTMKAFTDTLALRIMEGLSQISIFDSVFCVGEAKYIRKAWKTGLVKWHRQRSEMGKGPIKAFDSAKLWARIRRANGQEIYKPFQII